MIIKKDDQRDRLRDILLGPKKHKDLGLEEIRETGKILYQNAEQIGLYGLSPSDLVARGCRIVGRTAIECKVDQHCRMIAGDIRRIVDENYPEIEKYAVTDLFLGSGNLLYHIAKGLNAKVAVGYETDKLVFRSTQHNFRQLEFNSFLKPSSFKHSNPEFISPDHFVVVVIDPPWGNGFSFEKGLDLTRTDPPVREIVKRSISMFGNAAGVVLVIVTHERTDERSVQGLVQSYPILERGVTSGLIDGSNAGYLICSTG